METIVDGTLFDGTSFLGPSRVRIEQSRISAIEPLPGGPNGRTITPGFVDAHVHLTRFAEDLTRTDIHGLSREAVLDTLRTAPAVGGWVRAGGLTGRRFGGIPDRHVLDRLRSEPMAVWGADLHTIVFNTPAIRALGLDEAPDIPGGTIEREGNGFPSGIVRERAEEIFAERVPHLPVEAMGGALEEARRLFLAAGVTGVVTYEVPNGLATLANWDAQGLEVVRFGYRDDVRRALAEEDSEVLASCRGVKVFLDGTLGSRTAWMKDPYNDTLTCGTPRVDPDIRADLDAFIAAGLIPSFHAIGDAAFKAGLSLLAGRPGRIEHIQVVDPDDLLRVTQALTASVQPAHMASDRDEVHPAWGDRVRHAYPYRSLAEAGARLILGSDAPIVPPSALSAIAWAVDRRRSTDEEPFVPEEAIAVDLALAAHTQAAHDTLAMGPGRLGPGAEATLCLIDGDLRTEDGRLAATVLKTFIRGKEVYRSASSGV